MTTHQLIQLQQFSTCAMTGVIWIVQWLVYPSFRLVPESAWRNHHHHHTAAISFVVIPLMLAELGSCIRLLLLSPAGQTAQAVLLAIIWISTFAIQVPIHRRLASEWNPALIEKLIRTNWIRTMAWTAKAFLSFEIAAV